MSVGTERVVYRPIEMYTTLPEELFRLGYRWVKQTRPDGTVEMGVTPLLPEDLLYPEEEDRPVVRYDHTADCITLYVGFQALLADAPGTLVLMDHRVDFGPAVDKPLGPDVAVFADVPPDHGAPTLRVVDLGVRPLVMVEITSPDNAHNDLEDKVDLYHRAGVACYVIVDARHDAESRVSARLLGYRYAPAGFEPIPLDDRGWLRVEPLDCWLTLVDKQVVIIDGTGRPMDPPHEQIQARHAAEARAEQAEAQAQAANARADAEAAGRRAVEAELAAMMAELRRLRGEG